MSFDDGTYSPAQQRLLALANATAGWGEHARCIGDPRFTVEEPPIMKDRKRLDADRRVICMGCPVRFNCLMHSLDFPEQAGFWGGFNKLQRDQMRHERRKNPKDAIWEVAKNDANWQSDS